jgi:hypothetical protein
MTLIAFIREHRRDAEGSPESRGPAAPGHSTYGPQPMNGSKAGWLAGVGRQPLV